MPSKAAQELAADKPKRLGNSNKTAMRRAGMVTITCMQRCFQLSPLLLTTQKRGPKSCKRRLGSLREEVA